MSAIAEPTQIAATPSGWDVLQFSDLFEFKNGVNADKRAYGHGVPFANVLEVITNSHLHAELIPGRVALDSASIKAFDVRPGDVLFNRTSETQGEVGLSSVYLDGVPVVFGGFVIRGRPKRPIHSVYAGYALRAPAVRSQIVARGQGAIRANIGQGDLRRVVAVLPSPKEQAAIAGALSDADALIGELARLIAKRRDLKRAAMQQLLTGKTRLPGFAGEWRRARVGELGTFGRGQGIKKDDVVASGLPCIRYGEIYTRHSDYIREFYSFIPREVAKASTRLHVGDLLFAGSGETAEEIGKCVAFLGSEEAYAGGDILILSPHGHDSRYLGYLMNHTSVAAQKARMGQGDAVVHISGANLARVELRLPKPEEQRAIAVVFADMDAEIAGLEARRDKTRLLKQGMMQELLTGRIRLA